MDLWIKRDSHCFSGLPVYRHLCVVLPHHEVSYLYIWNYFLIISLLIFKAESNYILFLEPASSERSTPSSPLLRSNSREI